MVRVPVMVRRNDPYGGPIVLFLIPASAPRMVQQRLVCALLSVGWCTYKRHLLLIEEQPMYVAAAGFISCYLNGHLHYV